MAASKLLYKGEAWEGWENCKLHIEKVPGGGLANISVSCHTDINFFLFVWYRILDLGSHAS